MSIIRIINSICELNYPNYSNLFQFFQAQAEYLCLATTITITQDSITIQSPIALPK